MDERTEPRQPQQTPQPPQQPNIPPKKKGRLGRFLVRLILFFVALAMVLGAVALVAFRDTLNLDAAKRWLHYRRLMLSDSGQAESFLYDGEVTDTFAVLDGDLLVCSNNAISLYSGSGTRYVSQAVSLDNPVVESNGSVAVVYDAGGSDLYVLGQRELIWSTDELDTILAARLNKNGQLTVVTQASRHRGAVTVYDAAYRPVMSVRISSAFVMDAALSDDGHTLAILTIGQEEGDFSSSLSLYTLNSALNAAEESADFVPEQVFDLGGNVVLSLRHTRERVWALGERGLSILSHGEDAAWVDWSDRYLKSYDLSGDEFAVALLGKYRAGSQAVLLSLDGNGTTLGRLEVSEQVLSLSVAGDFIAVLTGDRLDIYTRDLSLYSSLEGTQGARKALLMEDGSAILISADRARFHVPS